MDFFKMNFSTLFIEKHGKNVFYQIRKQIVQESHKKINIEFIEIIFKIAYFSFWGLNSSMIEQLLEDLFPNQKVPVEKLQSLHQKSICTIQSYLQASIL